MPAPVTRSMAAGALLLPDTSFYPLGSIGYYNFPPFPRTSPYFRPFLCFVVGNRTTMMVSHMLTSAFWWKFQRVAMNKWRVGQKAFKNGASAPLRLKEKAPVEANGGCSPDTPLALQNWYLLRGRLQELHIRQRGFLDQMTEHVPQTDPTKLNLPKCGAWMHKNVHKSSKFS